MGRGVQSQFDRHSKPKWEERKEEGRKRRRGRGKGRIRRKNTSVFPGNTYFIGEVLSISRIKNKLSFWLSNYLSHSGFNFFYLSEAWYSQIAHVGWNPWAQVPLASACAGNSDTCISSKINFIVRFPSAPTLRPQPSCLQYSLATSRKALLSFSVYCQNYPVA